MAKPNADVRVATVRVLHTLHVHGGSLTTVLPKAQKDVAQADQALLQMLCYGMARWSGKLSALVDGLLQKPLKPKDLDVYLMLQLGVFQLAYTRIAPHAAVDNTVKACVKLGKPWAKGLANAVLRNYQRKATQLESQLTEDELSAHPDWLLEKIKHDWPEQWPAIVEQANQQAPMTLRVNRSRTTRDAFLASLEQQNLSATSHQLVADAVVLEKPADVQQIPGFTEGLVSVQDAAAQLAAQLLLPVAANGRYLDACAAPGGKTAHALETGYWETVWALDSDAERMLRVHQTLDRLSLNNAATCIAADAGELSQWWDNKPFNAILLDAPCSGSGVIRRHPDIKLLRRASDIEILQATQQKLLHSLWSTLAPGGQLLYATCSIFKDENEHQIAQFLSKQSDAQEQIISADWGQQRSQGRQILPGEHGMDGFYYALLQKRC